MTGASNGVSISIKPCRTEKKRDLTNHKLNIEPGNIGIYRDFINVTGLGSMFLFLETMILIPLNAQGYCKYSFKPILGLYVWMLNAGGFNATQKD